MFNLDGKGREQFYYIGVNLEKQLGGLPVGIRNIEDARSVTSEDLSSVVLRTLRNCVRKSTRGIPISIADINEGISGFLTRKSSPNNLSESFKIDSKEERRGGSEYIQQSRLGG